MNQEITTVWHDDWQNRLSEFLAETGYQNLEEFLDANPAVPYIKLATMAKSAHLAAMQIYGLHLRQAAAEGNLRNAARDAFARFIAEHVKRGWKVGIHFSRCRAGAFADWITTVRHNSEGLDEAELEAKCDRVCKELERLDPPAGWRPTGRDDEFLVSAFDAGWPES